MGKKNRVLIVEDDVFLSDICSHQLTAEGMEVEVAFNGIEGMKAITKQRPDIMILDLIMPGVSGFDLLEKISNKGRLDFPVITLTNLGQDEDRKRVKTLGCEIYLVKTSVSIDEVVAYVKKQLK